MGLSVTNGIGSLFVLQMTSPRPSPEKRQRRTFLWRRLIDQPREYDDLVVEERPNVALLDMMLDMDRDNEVVQKSIHRMEAYAQDIKRHGGVRQVIYQQKDYARFGGDSYEGSTQFGRAYTSSRINVFPRKVLNTIYKETHVEIDIKASYVTMLYTAFKDLGLRSVELIASRPHETYAAIGEDTGATLGEVKTMVNSMVCSYPTICYGLEGVNDDLVESFSSHNLVRQLRADLHEIAQTLRKDYPGFHSLISTRALSENKQAHVDGIAMSFLAADMEHSVMRTVIDKLFPGEKSDLVWLADGVIIPVGLARGSDGSFEQLARELETMIQTRMEIAVKFGFKDLRNNSLAISLSDAELNDGDGYKRWKRIFERKFFTLQEPPIFCQILPDGRVQDLNQVQFNHNTMEQPEAMIKKWRSDATKRSYVARDFAPPPLVCKTDHYNTYTGLAAEKWEEIPDDVVVDLEPYKEHVRILMGGDEESKSQDYADYFHKLIALKIQQPGSVWRVVPFLWSIQGAGKDLWFDFIGRILGSNNILKLASLSELVNSSALMESRLFVCISETNYLDTKAHNDALKDLVSAHEIVVKKKYVNSYKIRNSCAIIAFSNSSDAFQTTGDDRRLFPVRAAGLYANDPEYFGKLIPYFDNPHTAKAVYDWYMDMDLSDFNSSGDRPITEAFRSLVSSSANILELMLHHAVNEWCARVGDPGVVVSADGTVRVQTAVFLESFMVMAAERKILGCDSKSKMTQFLSKLETEFNARSIKHKTVVGNTHVIDSIRTHGRRYRRIDIQGVRAYVESILNANQLEEDDGEEENGYTPGFRP